MKSIVGIYESSTDAVAAMQELKEAGLPLTHISMLGKADLENDSLSADGASVVQETEVGLGLVVGSVLGVLTGVGIFAIPGLGFLYGAGAMIGAIAGFDLGLIGGGIVAILTAMGIDEASSMRYEKLLQEEHFIIIIQGSPDEVRQAREVLHTTDNVDINTLY